MLQLHYTTHNVRYKKQPQNTKISSKTHKPIKTMYITKTRGFRL